MSVMRVTPNVRDRQSNNGVTPLLQSLSGPDLRSLGNFSTNTCHVREAPNWRASSLRSRERSRPKS